MSRGELITSSLKIDRLRNKILEGEIKIPPFQRQFVWKKEQVVELLDSIYNDYPIGSVLLWETNEDLPSNRNVGGYNLPDNKAEYPINYILDGQQRVTSIFSVFCFDLEKNLDEVNDSTFDIYFDLDEKKFVAKEDMMIKNQNLPLKLLFNNFDFNQVIREYDREKNELAVNLQSLFQNYEIPTITIKKRTKSEVGVIFERINNTGTPLSTLDLMIAWTWKEDYHLKEEFDDIYDLLDTKSFGNIKQKIILQCFGAIIKKTAITKEILELDPEEVRSNTMLLKTSLEKAIDYIYTQFNIFTEDLLPKSHQLVPLTYLFSKTNRLDIKQAETVKKWFWRTSLSDRYTSSTDKKIDEDIAFFEEVLNNKFEGINKYHSMVSEQLFAKQKFIKSNYYVRSFLLILGQKDPMDLSNGNFIDLGNALSTYNRKEYHHVFPRAFLKDSLGLDNNKINVVSNFCFLPASSNKIISDKSPSEYFFETIPQEKFETILRSNLLPINKDIYANNDFDLFIKERAHLINKEINELTGENNYLEVY
ncbi:DUF262 domain-containing protein [Alkalihalobacillus macyae]|uniref:DUF262 domain-containing protein n=1 Tax=Guptibacillus hwajinpoensis TaxID=208199 RepID=UPI00273CAEF3|nr:DUF262 domain-containing protein [Alkalihalobacillus macyae]MDP4549692.1 DUF262 domain-containing protein [Alkalihalobacillus macyae]